MNKITSLYLLALALSLLVACKETESPKDEDGFVVYTIKKGSQSSNLSTLKDVSKTELNFRVIFDSSAIYTTIDSNNQEDVNKLYGFSDCNTQHHDNSARFGWRWSNNALRLFAYCYKSGNLAIKEMGEVEIGKEHVCNIRIDNDKYIFTLNHNKMDTMERGCTDPKSKKYMLFPFFGGDEMAPHDITIRIKEE